MKKNINIFALTAVITLVASSFALAQVSPVLDYKILINGTEAASHSLAAGTHAIEIQAQVSNNDLTGGGVHGGLLQSAFDLTDTAGAIQWEDIAGGFIGGSNGLWDSTANAAFDSHFQGTLADGGTDVIAETGAIAPGDFTTQFGDIGANVFSFIASGNFTWDGNDTTIDLTIDNPFGGDIIVAALNGSAIVGGVPTTVNGASTMLTAGTGGNLAPTLADSMGGTKPDRIYTADLSGDASDDGPLSELVWSITGVSGPTTPDPNSYMIDNSGLFTWDTTGIPQSNTADYDFAIQIVDMNGSGLSGMGTHTVRLPEPSTMILASLSLVGVYTRRRKS